MGFQNSINNMLGTAGAVATLGKHMQNQKEALANQEKELAAKNAEDQQIVNTTKNAIRNDTIEAATAIAAHEPEFKAALDQGGYDLKNISDDQIDSLAKEVDSFRSGKLAQDRINNMNDIKDKINIVKELGKKDKTVDDMNATNDRLGELNSELSKAYDSFRELNNRIEASRALKFNLDSAQARIKARGVK